MNRPFFFSLAAIALCTLLLLFAAMSLHGLAEANARMEWEQTMRVLLPGSDSFAVQPQNGDGTAPLRAYKGETGYVLEVCTQGYAGEITLAVGISNGGTVTGLQIRNLSETWGLGREALQNGAFLAQFLNTSGDARIGDNVDALTGATVTSNAIARGVNAAVAWVTGTDADSGATAWGD